MSGSCTTTDRRRRVPAQLLCQLALAGVLATSAGVTTATAAHAQAAPPGGYGPSAPESPTDLGLTGPVAVTATVGAAGATLVGAAEGGLTPTLVVPPGVLPRPAQVTVRLLPVNPLPGGSPVGYLGGWLVTVTAPDGGPFVRFGARPAAAGGAMNLEVRGAAVGHPDQVVTVITPSGSTQSGEAVEAGVFSVPVTGTSTAVVLTGPAAAGAPGQQPQPQPGRGGENGNAGGNGNAGDNGNGKGTAGGNGSGTGGRGTTQRAAALPTTGSSTSVGVATGATAVGLGSVLLLLGTRRRRTGER